MGVRYLCQSIAPGILSGADAESYLTYGKVDKGTKAKCDPEVDSVVREVFGGMGMAGRWIDGVEVFGPVELKGLKGNDGRRYFLEAPRLTPRDANWIGKEEGGTGGAETWQGKGIPKSVNDPEWSALVLRPELIEAYKEYMLTEAREKIVTDMRGKIKAAMDLFEKEIAEELKKIKEEEEKDEKDEGVEEDVKVKRKEERQKKLTDYIKGKQEESTKVRDGIVEKADEEEKDKVEEARAKGKDVKFNVNVFMGVKPDDKSKEDWSKDEELARELARFATDVVVPKLTEAVRSRGGGGYQGTGRNSRR